MVTNDKNNDRYNAYIKNIKGFNKSGQGHKGQKIQNQIKDWDSYPNGKICININPTVYKTGGCYLNWNETAINVNAIWEKDSISKLKLVKDSYPLSNSKDVLIFSLKDLGLFDNKSPNNNLKTFFDKFNELIISHRIEQKKRANMQNLKPYMELLEANKNLILTGAPGTGKTYLARQIALSITDKNENKIEFVQFHPSYDYTDFVEGLRPTKPDENGNIGFELKDGVFKSLCKRALSQKNTDNFDEIYTDFIDELSESNVEFETPTLKKKFKVEINSNKTCVAIPDTDIGTRMSITKEMIKEYVLHGDIRDWKPYTIPIAEYFKKYYEIKIEKPMQNRSPFVFIIDEINRAEISKVFGELFFSIDPGYRGEKGKVKTQYSNLQDADDVFADGFFVPENVFMIGTMNDIDRSVESMDFAMRRRFAWKEVKAEDRVSMWDGRIDTWKVDALKRMNSLNKAIESVQGLGSAYHIGPAYFLKLENYHKDTNPFESLWNNHLEGVVFEYLRGLPDSEELMSKLKNAYNKLIDVEND